MKSKMYLDYNGVKFLVARDAETYYLAVRKGKDKTAVYYIAKSRVDLNGNILGENSAHVISCLKWEASLSEEEAAFVKRNL